MLKAALTRYRAVAYVVGVLLLLLTAGMVAKYGFGDDTLVALVGPVHGFAYIVYLLVTADLWRRAGWSIGYTALILLAGTVPLLSFVAERSVTRRVRTAEPVPAER